MSIPIFICVIFAACATAVSQYEKLFVISYDAFRYDYFNRNITPFMNELRNNATHADYMENIFVTKTFPNHYTIVTGLFAENHGVVGNAAFDPKTGELDANSSGLFHYNEEIAPIWIINEKNDADRHSGVVMWPGCQYEYLGVKPTFYQAYNSSWPWETRADELISWFTHPETPINLGVLYIEEPDDLGHALGINSPEFNAIIEKLDRFTKYIYDKLNESGLRDVNVIHLSDHGMQTITKERIIDLNNFVNASDYSIVESSAGLQIFPKPEKFDVVYSRLVDGAKRNGHFTVYKKEEIPDKYHFGKNPRIAPIFIVADTRYAFNDMYEKIEHYEETYNFTSNNQTEFGVHGYDNNDPDMRPMFFAYGPMFKKHYKLDPFNNTDLFPLFCEILDLSCPPANGTLENVKYCLNTPYDGSTLKIEVTIIGVLILLGLCSALVVSSVKRRKDKSKAYYRILPTESDREYPRNGNPDPEMA